MKLYLIKKNISQGSN